MVFIIFFQQKMLLIMTLKKTHIVYSADSENGELKYYDKICQTDIENKYLKASVSPNNHEYFSLYNKK